MNLEEEVPRKTSCKEAIRRIPQRIADMVEHFFYQLGLKIAQQPLKWLVGTIMIILVSLSGLYFFRQEKNPIKLWVPQDSEFAYDTEWLISRFGEGLRLETMIFTADNVLEPGALTTLNDITKQILSTQTSDQIVWTDVCFKVPVISGVVNRGKRSIGNRADDFFDLEPDAGLKKTIFEPAVYADSKLYCHVVNHLPRACLMHSILDIWEYDNNLIMNQTKEDIVTKLNKTKVSPTMGHPTNFIELLGDVTKDSEGRIISAKAVKTQWVVHINFSIVDMETFGNDAGTADWATDDVLKWELSILDVFEQNAKLLQEGKHRNHTFGISYEVGRSFGDITSTTLFQNFDKLMIGFALMFIYVVVLQSDYNWIEWRFYLAIMGLICVGAAFLVAVSVCSVLGIPYGPVHTSLPFLLLSLGVDDNFLMMASWKEIHALKSNQIKPLEERIALMLGNAGAAISITSLTDVVAFVIGASTILPSLQSYCIYAAVGVLLTFLLQITLYISFFTLDAQRIESKRNAAIPWIVHENFTQNFQNPEEAVSAKFIKALYSKVVLSLPGKILIVLITIVVTVLGIVGTVQLEVWFDPMWFVPEESYLNNFHRARQLHYPDSGYDGTILMGDIDYSTEFSKIMNLTERFENLSTVQIVKPWPNHFAKYVLDNFEKDLRNTVLDDEEFRRYLSSFLFSQSGGKYQGNFRFDGKLECGKDVPRILVGTIDFTFKQFSGPHECIPAMDGSKLIARQSGIDGYVAVWSKSFSLWVTDKLIGQEVRRNLVLALICVMGMTGVLIAEPQTCCWILLCVLLTLLNVCGFMFFWGLTIDITSCIALELAIGLSVDYAAHVAHAFVHAASVVGDQDRTARAHVAVRYIGAAVAYGAGSTLLALSMMVFTDSYIFQSFFKIFFLVIVFGIWHGLIFLPVVLSTIGPRSLRSHAGQQSPVKIDVSDPAAVPLRKVVED